MKNKDWREKLRELSFMKGYYFKLEDNGLVEKKDGQLVFNRKELEGFIQQEIEKAREEGREESKREYAQAIATGQKVELTEELVDRIWSANLEEMYKMGLTKLLKSKEDGK